MKNCNKLRNVNRPYQIWKNDDGWEWRVLKKYPNENLHDPGCKWFCAVKSPINANSFDLIDVYSFHLYNNAYLIEKPTKIEKW